MEKRSNAHVKAQNDGKKRDLYRCQICGSSEKVEGHHIFDVQFNGAADKENIVALCKEHHKKVHQNKIDITSF